MDLLINTHIDQKSDIRKKKYMGFCQKPREIDTDLVEHEVRSDLIGHGVRYGPFNKHPHRPKSDIRKKTVFCQKPREADIDFVAHGVDSDLIGHAVCYEGSIWAYFITNIISLLSEAKEFVYA